jgi:hypothetical protein
MGQGGAGVSSPGGAEPRARPARPPWDFGYAPVATVAADDDDGGPLDVVVAPRSPVAPDAVAAALSPLAPRAQVEAVLEQAPLAYRLQGSQSGVKNPESTCICGDGSRRRPGRVHFFAPEPRWFTRGSSVS